MSLLREQGNLKLERLRSCHLSPIPKSSSDKTEHLFINLISSPLFWSRPQRSTEIKPANSRCGEKNFTSAILESSHWLHHCHGGNVPHLLLITMTFRKKASLKMKASHDQISQYTSDQIKLISREQLRWLKMRYVSSVKSDMQKQRKERIYQENNSHFITTIFRSKTNRDWLWTKRGLKVGCKIRKIQALSCTLPTKVNKTWGNPDMSDKQWKCKSGIEDDTYILNSCKSNYKLITLWHDHLVAKIAKEPNNSYDSAEIWMERHWRSDLQLVKPDITMIKDGHCYIIEVTCPYEARSTLSKGHVTKFLSIKSCYANFPKWTVTQVKF